MSPNDDYILILSREYGMALRTFIFCDICNPQAIRQLEYQRSMRRESSNGRRVTDGRIWFDGSEEEALKAGWVHWKGFHVCPNCCARKVVHEMMEYGGDLESFGLTASGEDGARQFGGGRHH